jgi:hypothetical protein
MGRCLRNESELKSGQKLAEKYVKLVRILSSGAVSGLYPDEFWL